MPDNVLTIATSQTLQSDWDYHAGIILSVPSGITLTVPDQPDARRWQVFDVSGGGTVVLPAGCQVLPEWFGAIPGTSTAAAAAAFGAALTAAKTPLGELFLGVGTYYADRVDLSGIQSFTLRGTGINSIIQARVAGSTGQAFVQINSGSGGDEGSHPTQTAALLVTRISFQDLAQQWDKLCYADKMYDSRFEQVQFLGGKVGLDLNYSWTNSFSGIHLEYWKDIGVRITSVSNATTFTTVRNTAANSATTSVGWDIRAGRTLQLIGCTAEACNVGIRQAGGESMSFIGYHCESNGTDVLYNYGNTRSGILTFENCAFYDTTSAVFAYDVGSNQSAYGLNIKGCFFHNVPASSVTLLASGGVFEGNANDSSTSPWIALHNSHLGVVRIGKREYRGPDGFTDFNRGDALATGTSNTTLFKNIPANCSIRIQVKQRLSSTNTSSHNRLITVGDGGAKYAESTGESAGSALGLVFSVSSGDLLCHGTYASPWSAEITVTGAVNSISS